MCVCVNEIEHAIASPSNAEIRPLWECHLTNERTRMGTICRVNYVNAPASLRPLATARTTEDHMLQFPSS